MKITEVQSFLMSYALPQPLKLPFHGGERTILKRDAMLIRVKTDTGLIGYAPGPAHERAQKEIHEVIRPFLLGKDPRRWAEIKFAGDLEIAKTYCAVEIALMDLAARYEGCPLSEVIGGRQRDRIKLYGSAGMYMSPEGYAREAAHIAGMGFSAYKMRPALGPEQDLKTVELMRQAVGPNVGLMIDAHSWWRMGDKSYSLQTVIDLAREMAKFNPTWLEEPIPPDDHEAYRALRAQKILPIATGEHEQEEEGFDDLIQTGAADYIQMDVCCQGGFAMGRRIFANVQQKKLRFAFHSWGTALEVLAAAHLGICWPADVVEWLEFPIYTKPGCPVMYPWPLAEEILRDPFEIDRGDLVVPKGPGLGIDIDERVIEKYPFIPGPWSFFRIDSPLETVAVTGDHSVKWISAENPLPA
ncbi:MAG TPA: mandelate racemase/muconate lactonizing enzyme family protein [Verrucomicrobiae bacterium]|jgi:L-alanine-DL-glutamate epimerase-like enolase superfamily enzyme|nr:mandelate racemase/muconate lactonizing enzyme family protein [Verrucomicrobiae bacterium]